MKCYRWMVLLVISWLCTIPGIAQKKIERDTGFIYLADPTILYNRGTYYLYGTVEGNSNLGFLVFTSPDLKSWILPKTVSGGYALKKGDTFGQGQFWAPQVLNYNNTFYMAFAANEHIAIAESKSPLGPFTQVNKDSLAAPVKQIDPFVFIDDDGTPYLYHVRLTGGNKIFVAKMTGDLSAIESGTLRECITASEPWENTAHSGWPVTEGPSVLKHNNLYYLFYTANDFRNPDYAVGYAVSKSPYGPWQKYQGNPILSKQNLGKNGTGHGDFLKDGKGNLLYVFHTHYSDSLVAPRRTAIVKASFQKDSTSAVDKLVIDKNSFYFLERKDK